MGAVTITIEANFSGSTWTDISSYLESEVTISGGRQDELSQADANQCSFTLDNLDGRFTPGKTTGAYYPNVKVGVPIRVSASLDGGLTTSRRFTGYVDSWALSWDDDVPRVAVQASSILSRLGLLSELKSAIEEEILEDGPAAYYPLQEQSGTVGSEISGNGLPALTPTGSGTTLVLGTDTGLTVGGMEKGVKLQGSGVLGGPDGNGQILQGSASFTAYTVEVWFKSNMTTAGQNPIIQTDTPGAISIAVEAGGAISVNGGVGNVTYSTGSLGFDTSSFHHYAATIVGGNLTLYVDGAAVGTDASGPPLSSTAVQVGGNPSGNRANGIALHAALFTTGLDATRIAAHYNAGLSAFADETVAARLARYATWGNVAAYSATSTAPVAADAYSGASVVDLLHNLETSEGGVLYDERDGTLTLGSRQSRYTATTAASFDATAQQVESSFTPTTDRQGLTNDVTVTTSGAAAVNLIDAASQTAYGVARTTIDTLATEDQDPLTRAQWELAAHATPTERVPTLGVDILNCGLDPATLLALTVGSRVAVTNPPSQAAGPGDYFIEGWSETFDPTSYVATFNVSPAQPWVNTLILDDATRGVLDSTYVLAY